MIRKTQKAQVVNDYDGYKHSVFQAETKPYCILGLLRAKMQSHQDVTE